MKRKEVKFTCYIIFTILVITAGCSSTNESQDNPVVIEAEISHVSYHNGNDGAISLNISGGNPPYSVHWDNGDTSQTIINLPADIYSTTVSDSENRSTEKEFEVKEPAAPQNLTNNPANDLCPAWANDGQSIYFISNRGGLTGSGWYGYEIWRIDTATKNASLIPTRNKSIREIRLSPNGQSIVFHAGATEEACNVYVVPINGGIEEKIADSDGRYSSISYSPDGTRYMLSAELGGERDVWLINIQKNQWTSMTSDTYNDYSPAWSPNGVKIVYVSQRTDMDLYIIHKESHFISPLLSLGLDISKPGWSPDSKAVVFTLHENGISSIRSVDIETTEVKKLIVNNYLNDAAVFSPDGKSIAFQSEISGSNDIFIYKTGIN